MKKHKQKQPLPLFKKLLIVAGIILALLLSLVALIFFWPLRSSQLQTSTPVHMEYSDALAEAATISAAEQSLGVKSECASTLMDHGKKTDKVVVMFHGVSACPKQFKALAKTFFDAGYNVYVPLAPHHGTDDPNEYPKVRSKELTKYVDQSINVATGLGKEVGVAGLSGGGMLATWATHYRTDISRALILSPFYEPAASHAPKWQLQFLNVLYGHHIMPDQLGAGFSYRALANYNIVTKNLKKNPTGLDNLKSLSVITSPNDGDIDLNLAASIPDRIANSNKLTYNKISLPKEWGVGHDIVAYYEKPVAAYQSQLYQIYLNAYEGRNTDL